jgi:phosphatidylglycerophosphate synthase
VVRVSRVSLAGSACLLSADLVWVALGRPPLPVAAVAWFASAALLGLCLSGLANQLTLTRAHLAVPALVYTLEPGKLMQLVGVVVAGGLSDVLDGYVARRWEGTTRLGGGLDPVVDGILFGAVAAGLAGGGALPLWLAAAVVGRYALPALGGAVLLAAGRHPELRHTPLGQASTVLIAVLLGGVALLRGLDRSPALVVEVAEVAIPVAALATFVNLAWANRRSIAGRPAV